MVPLRENTTSVSPFDGAAFDGSAVPPHAPQAEAALLGSLIFRPEALAAPPVEPDDLYSDRHRLIFRALHRLSSAGVKVDAVTLAEELQRTGRLDEAGGVTTIVELMQTVPHAEHLGHYAAQVREAASRRRMIERAAEAVRMAMQGNAAERVAAQLDAAKSALASSDGSAVVRSLAAVPSERLAWLWPGRIPLGKLTLLAGDPGLGKSFVTLDLAARVSSGRGWPDEREAGETGDGEATPPLVPRLSRSPASPGDVLLFGAEDDLGDTVRPRLEAAGADLDRIVAIEGVRGGGGPRGFSLATDLPRLDAVLAGRPEAKLVVIDPITAYCGGVDTHKNADVRALLAPLAELAARRKVAVVAVTHLNKAAGSKAIYRAMGSLAYVAAARVGWLVVKDAGDPRRRLLLPVKNNLAEDIGGLAYRIDEGRVQWEEGRIDLDADEMLEGGRRGSGGRGEPGDGFAPRRHRADDWLEERLADGPVPASRVLEEAVGAGLTYKMIRDAKRRIGVRTERQGADHLMRLDPDRTSDSPGDGPRDLAGHPDLFEDPFAGR